MRSVGPVAYSNLLLLTLLLTAVLEVGTYQESIWAVLVVAIAICSTTLATHGGCGGMRATSARQSIGRPTVSNNSGCDSEQSSPRIQFVCAALSTSRDTVSFKVHARFRETCVWTGVAALQFNRSLCCSRG